MEKESTDNMTALSEVLKGKHVVTDTSSLLMAGTGLLSMVRGCYLVIPAVVVQELEDKRIHPTIGFLAREWLRLLEDNRVKHGLELAKGVELEDYGVYIQVEPNHSTQKSLPNHLQNGSADSTVLAVAKNLTDEGRKVAVLSNDVPMRLHATLDLELDAYEFNATRIIGAKAFDGVQKITISYDDYNSGFLFDNGERIEIATRDFIEENLPEDCAKSVYVKVVLESGEKVSDFVVINNEFFKAGLDNKRRVGSLVARTPEQNVALAYLQKTSDELPIVSLGGKAGSGKTLLAIANGIEQVSKGIYQKMIVFRSLHEMGAGQEMGFLPGTVDEKMEAWAGAIYDSIDVIARASANNNNSTHKEKVKGLREIVEVSPITYLRGRSLADTYIVLEEAQNFSRSEILNILSRVGEGSKVVLTFDAAQVDNKFLKSGKDADIWSVVDTLKNEELFAHITLNKTERSKVAELAARTLEK